MKIIGLNHDMFISSAALVEDGRIIAAAAEERFTREKITRAFPLNVIKYILKEAKCDIEDIDYFASSWNPGIYFEKFNPLISGKRRSKTEYLYSIPDHILLNYRNKGHVDYIEQKIKLLDSNCRIFYITHHRAHAANAFFISPFKEAAILTADAQGEFESTTYGKGCDNHIEIFKAINYPQSIGGFYSTFTEFLGFRSNSDEWKVMALAAFADWKNQYYEIMKEEVVKLLPNGEYEFDLNYFKGYNLEQPNLFTEKMVQRFGHPRIPDDTINERHYEIAAALQKVTEEIVFHILDWLYEETKLKNLAVSGGTFMNSVLNGKIIEQSPFEHVFISSCPDDSGNAIGAAYYLYNHILGNENREELTHNFFGPSYTDDTIRATLDKYRMNYKQVDDIESYSAKLIAGGKLLGWLQGRMEFGQRALGNRSILVDPRDAKMKDKVNSAVKYRESFRPFAPSVLEEYVKDYFEIDEGMKVPFMEKVYPIKKEVRDLIPAVVHQDGTGRLQSVSKEINPRFYRLIDEFRKITNIPILLNTSFNLKGEPIVCSPTDAIRTFYSCGLDVLVMGNYVVFKNSREDTNV